MSTAALVGQTAVASDATSASLDNHITILADSSPGQFEGPEKLLELWFAPSEQHVVDSARELKGDRKGKAKWTGLRQVAKSVWDSMLDEVQCKVLSVIEGEDVDSYLLSESSMFVWPHKLILKTCGTTTLLLGLPTLLRIASETCGFNGVWRCFYSRKTFMFPDQQKGPHKDWTQEMEFLDQLFDNSSAYTVGRMNGDHWLLYITPPRSDVLHPHALASSQRIAPQQPSNALSDLSATLSSTNLSALASTSPSSHSHFLHRPPPPHPSPAARPDQTLEMLMTRLHPDACAAFHHPTNPAAAYTSPLVSSDPHNTDAHALGASLSGTLGLDALLPGATTDSFLFSPCGFSSNSVLGDRYATIHVTPEVDYSYASFETNFVPPSGGGLAKLVEDVLKVFRPAKLSITLFVSQDEEDDASEAVAGDEAVVVGRKKAGMKELLNPDLLERYARVDRIVYEFDGYSLVYAVFEEKVVGEQQ